MKLFTDVRIGKRLGIGYAVIMVLLVILIGVGLTLMSSMDDAMDRIVAVNRVKVKKANEVGNAMDGITIALGRLILERSPAQRAEERKIIEEEHAQYKKALEEMEKLEINEEGKKLIAKTKEAVLAAREANNKVIDLAMAGRSAEASDLFVKVSASNTKAVDAAVSELIAYQEKRTEFRYRQSQQSYATAKIVLIVIGVLAIAIGIYLAFATTRSITQPIAKGVTFATEMAKGDLTQTIDVRQKDEVGTFAAALQQMGENLRSMFRDVGAGVRRLSTSSSELSAIAQQMSSRTEQTSEKSKSVATAAEEMSSSMTTVAAAMEQATTNLGSVATATEEMTSTVREIANNAEKARGITNSAVGKATSITEKVNELGTSARDIGKITEAISAISAQTNLLALNATIEAARAGAAGKGFAVVANEIKELAKQTATATEDIKSKIEAIQASTQSNIAEVAEVSGIIKEVNEIVSTIAAAIEEQSVTTKDIARNIAQASQGIQEVNQNVAQSSAVSKQIAEDISGVNLAATDISTSSAHVRLSASDLLKLAEQLNTMVSAFKTTGSGQAGKSAVVHGHDVAGEIEKALQAHGMWKHRLQAAIETGKTEHSVGTVKVDNACAFGKWLYSLPASEQGSETWKTVQKLHASFHEEAGRILDLALTNRKTEAVTALTDNTGRFATSSEELTTILLKWRESAS